MSAAPSSFTHALVRTPAPCLVQALGQNAGQASREDGEAWTVAIDYQLALRQHATYVGALREFGLTIVPVAPLLDYADACFVEDTAVVFGDAALVTRPGAPSRRGEEESVAWVLGNLGLALTRMLPPATLDGGDVLRVGNTFFVGRSERTNREGIAALAAFAAHIDPTARVVVVDLPPDLLHLKCHVSALSDDTVLAVADLALDLPTGVRRIDLPRAEAFAANAVAHNSGVLVAAGHARAAEILAAAGFLPRPLDTSEFKKAAGSLTCLSVLC